MSREYAWALVLLELLHLPKDEVGWHKLMTELDARVGTNFKFFSERMTIFPKVYCETNRFVFTKVFEGCE